MERRIGNEIGKANSLFEKQPDCSYGFQKQEIQYRPTTVFLQATCYSIRALTFVTVIVPYSIKKKAVDIVQSYLPNSDGAAPFNKKQQGRITIQIDIERELNVFP